MKKREVFTPTKWDWIPVLITWAAIIIFLWCLSVSLQNGCSTHLNP